MQTLPQLRAKLEEPAATCTSFDVVSVHARLRPHLEQQSEEPITPECSLHMAPRGAPRLQSGGGLPGDRQLGSTNFCHRATGGQARPTATRIPCEGSTLLNPAARLFFVCTPVLQGIERGKPPGGKSARDLETSTGSCVLLATQVAAVCNLKAEKQVLAEIAKGLHS